MPVEIDPVISTEYVPDEAVGLQRSVELREQVRTGTQPVQEVPQP
ncbi:hypothetical protein [Nocardiopsis quinghaiensis]|nr:hypothetical protein [Nocardiopsis quinghaiensis]